MLVVSNRDGDHYGDDHHHPLQPLLHAQEALVHDHTHLPFLLSSVAGAAA